MKITRSLQCLLDRLTHKCDYGIVVNNDVILLKQCFLIFCLSNQRKQVSGCGLCGQICVEFSGRGMEEFLLQSMYVL